MTSAPEDAAIIRTPIPPTASGYADVDGVHKYYELTARARRSRSCTAGCR